MDVHHSGSGPRALLLHSGFHTWVEWRRTIELLAVDHEVLAPTLPGSAGGPPLDVRRPVLAQHADHAAAVLDDHGWTGPVLVVGSSFGGVCALELLARGRASQVVALAPPWAEGAGLAFYGPLFTFALSSLRATRRLWPVSTRIDLVNSLFFHSSRQPLQIDRKDLTTILDSVASFPFLRLGRYAGRTGPGMPVLHPLDERRVTLVWGGRDLLVPPWMRDRWEAALPGAEVLELPGFPHQPHWRDPERIADLVRMHATAS